MRACFSNYISLRPIAVSKSGLYMEDLPGFPVDLINKLRTYDNTSLEDFWSKFYSRAIESFSSYIGANLTKEFYNGEVFESRTSGKFSDDTNTTSETYAGVQFTLPRNKYRETNILNVRIDVVSFGSPLPTFRIFSKVGGTELGTFTPESLVVGENEIQVYQNFDSDYLYIAYSPSEVTLKKTSADDMSYSNQTIYTSIGQVNGGGIVVDMNNYCSIEKLICTRLHAFRNVLHHFLGRELMKERILTQEVNKYTVLSKDKAEELAALYNINLEEATKSAMKHMTINDDKLCMECRGTVAKKTILP